MFPTRRYTYPAFGLGFLIVLILLTALPGVNSLLLAQGELTATPNINWVREGSGVNVRNGPGLEYGILGQLALGAWVQPLARNINGDWILINYLTTQGWVQVDGVSWRLDVAALPVIEDPAPTPIPQLRFFNTPGGPTQTPNANWVNVGLDGAYVRAGPGQGYGPLGLVFTGDVVDPVAHDPAIDWVLVRYGDGYGWIRFDLVVWVKDITGLPEINEPNLTPSFTAVPVLPSLTNTPSVTPSATPTDTLTPSDTPTATDTATPTDTPTDTPTPTPSATYTDTPTATLSPVPTDTPTHTPTATYTATASPTASETPPPTATNTPTATDAPTATLTAIPTETPTATETPPPTLTASPKPVALAPAATETPVPPTPTPTATLTATEIPPSLTPTATMTASPTETATVTLTVTTAPTETASPTDAPTRTLVPTLTASPNSTQTPTPESPTLEPPTLEPPTLTNAPTETPAAVAAANDPGGGPSAGSPIATVPVDDTGGEQNGRLALLAGGGLAILAVLYAGIYVSQAGQLGRYQDGFMLTACPVCDEGELFLEERRYRLVGIPRVRRVVRCNACRSVLRQVGRGRWRYAVDGAANPELFAAFNGKVVSDDDLLDLGYRGAPPEYIEGDDLPQV